LRAQRARTKAAAADASEAIPHAQYELGGGGEKKLAVGAHAYMLGCKSAKVDRECYYRMAMAACVTLRIF
jgi:hypothetical protein